MWLIPSAISPRLRSFSVPFFTPLPVAFASFLTQRPFWLRLSRCLAVSLSAAFVSCRSSSAGLASLSVPLVAVSCVVRDVLRGVLGGGPNLFAAFPITRPVSAAHFAVSLAPVLACPSRLLHRRQTYLCPSSRYPGCKRTPLRSTEQLRQSPSSCSFHSILAQPVARSVLQYATLPRIGANRAHALSLSSALKVSSSTSHLFRMVKIVFVAEARRAPADGKYAPSASDLSVFSAASCARYSRACFFAHPLERRVHSLLDHSTVHAPLFRSVTTRMRPNFWLSRRSEE